MQGSKAAVSPSKLSQSMRSPCGHEALDILTNAAYSTVNVVSTLPGLYLVEKMGRRNLLLLGGIGMAASQFIVAITGTASDPDNLNAQRAAIAFVCIYIYFFASSWGPVAWVVTGESGLRAFRLECRY